MTTYDEARHTAIEAFARAIHPALTQAGAGYQNGPMNGHEWHWSTDAGAWAVTVGGALDAGPLVMGPNGNRWHTTDYVLAHADLVLLMLQLAGALAGRPAAMGLSARPPRRPPWQGPPQVAGSDLPPRGAGVRPPLPYPAGADGTPLGELSGRLYPGDRPYLVQGGGGPAEYGRDGVAYEGDRIYPADDRGANLPFRNRGKRYPADGAWSGDAQRGDDQAAASG